MGNLYAKQKDKYAPRAKGEEYGPSMGDTFQIDYAPILINPLEQIADKYSQRNKNYI